VWSYLSRAARWLKGLYTDILSMFMSMVSNGVVCMKYGAQIAFRVLFICYNPICYELELPMLYS
jgi:hypothetical protein